MSTTQDGFYVTGGTLRGDAPSYVRRQADDELYDGLMAGRFCYVLTPRQMGKSSLVVRTAERLRAEGVAVVSLDLTAFGQNLTAEQWYYGLLDRVGKELNLEAELEEFWTGHDRLGLLQRWMLALREVVLKLIKGRLVIFVDEIEYVRSMPFSTDEFFAAIREFYNRRTEDPELERLIVCLLGVASPSNLIRDTRTTPFNIGTRIELTDFSEMEAAPLVRGLRPDEATGRRLLKRILYWTCGHPYLTQRLCLAVSEDPSVKDARGVDRKCEELFVSSRARERDVSLLDVRQRILRSEEAARADLLDLYQKIRDGKRVPDDETNPLVSVLRLSGITRAAAGLLHVRNRIYHRAFDSAWISENMPDAEMRLRQRAVFFQRLFRAATALLVLAFIAATSLAVVANNQRNLAEKARVRADKNALELENVLAELRATLAEAERLRAEANQKSEDREKARQEALKESRKALEQSDIAQEQKRQAEEQRQAAESARAKVAEQSARNRRVLYTANMNLAQHAWEEGDPTRLSELLDEQKPESGEAEDLRGFEWFYLKRLAHSELLTTSRAESMSDGTEWHPAIGQILTLKGHDQGVTSFDFSPNGKYIVTAGHDKKVKVWDALVSTETAIHEFEGHDDAIREVVYSPDGTRIATASADKTARVWDAATGKELVKLLGHEQAVVDLLFSADSKLVVTGSADKTARVWDAATGKELSRFEGHTGALLSVAFSPDGTRVVSSSEDRTTRLWGVATGKEIIPAKGSSADTKVDRLRDYDQTVSIVAFSLNGKFIATGGADNTARIWDATTGEEVRKLEGHTAPVFNVAFAPDGKLLVTSSGDNQPKIWRLETGQEISLESPATRAGVATFTPQGKFVTINVSRVDTTITISYVSVGREAVVLKGHDSSVFNVAYSRDGKFIATGSADKTAKVWDAASGREVATLKGHTDFVFGVAFSPDSRRIVTGSTDNTARVWDAQTGKELFKYDGHDGSVLSVAFSPDGRRILLGLGFRRAKLWDFESGQVTTVFAGHKGPIFGVAFSPDGRRVVTGSIDETAKVWDAASGREVLTLKGHTGSVIGVAFSPDGRRVVTGSEDKTARVWDVQTGNELIKLRGHHASVFRVAFSPDGRRVVTSSGDKAVKVWDVKSGRETLTLKGHSGLVNSVAVSPDGQHIVSGGDDQTARIWNAAALEDMETLEKRFP